MAISKPFLWLPSAVWFDFLSRRLETLVDHQIRLYQRNPAAPNYLVMTGLFSYMMQSVLFTPTMVNPHVRESLALLNYKASANRFGMFFLQDLDMSLEIVLPEVLAMDDLQMLRSLGYMEKPIPQSPARPRLYEEDDEITYPIGKTPSWSDLTEMLHLQPWVIMRRWAWPADLDEYRDADEGSTAHLALKLFQIFTLQTWVTLNDHWKKDPDSFYQDMTLADTIELWTLEKIHENLKSYRIIPCNSDIHGSIPGPKAVSFAMRSKFYFVQEEHPSGKVWDVLGHPPGYIASYREETEKLDETQLDELDRGLETLFSYCQCLPNSKKDGEAVIWEVRKADVILLGNPRFYKLDSIGNGGRKRTTRRAPAHAGKVAIQTSLLRLTGLSKTMATSTLKFAKTVERTAAAKKKKSARASNRRQPPTRRKKQQEVPSSEDEEDVPGQIKFPRDTSDNDEPPDRRPGDMSEDEDPQDVSLDSSDEWEENNY
jgi:hypothetical protein